ncbi:hypothetical protein OHA77_33655 [Streptosporangium sp. NBC_01639]|uniref:hypothetical protein n=1 Tax=Streptosporangium sp. NBC_01639 TaxID=2975948 RepID=UPI003867C391|nr:hypothetical protein OHA77_33655 [Streptosporangium sp. NBC_01639]
MAPSPPTNSPPSWPPRSAILGLGIFDATTTEAIAAIARTTAGNFRLITRLLDQAECVMKLNELDRITAEAIDTARDALVIGTI